MGGNSKRIDAKRNGGALLMVLIVVTVVAAASAAILQLSSVYTRRQVRGEHDARAFYLAEAGLSEAYYGVTTGNTGQIGSREQPVASGDGLLWVDMTEAGPGRLRLECTALSGFGRSTLAITIERQEEPTGIFADQSIEIDEVLMLDGYDSEEAPYIEQAITSDPVADYYPVWNQTTLVAGNTGSVVAYEEKRTALLTEPCPTGRHVAGHHIDVHDYCSREHNKGTSENLDDYSTALAEEYHQLLQAIEGPGDVITDGTSSTDAVMETSPSSALAVHTTGGGRIGSNGSITFTTPEAAIYGDVVPGPDQDITAGDGVQITGSTYARKHRLELDPVGVPRVDMRGVTEHGGAFPLLISPSDVGYQDLRVRSDAQVVIRGPAVVVFGGLELDDGAELSIENLDGRVDLFVTGAIRLWPGSVVTVASEDPSQLSLQLAEGASPVELYAESQFYGMVYGPTAPISVEGPFEIYGVLVAGSLDLGANVRLHFDSGIAGEVGPLSLPKLISWEIEEVPAALRIRRYDAFKAMGLDEGELESPTEAQVSASWTVIAHYTNPEGKYVEYDGPFEQYTFGLNWNVSLFTLTEPEFQTSEPWTMYAQFTNWSGKEEEYNGTVQDYPHDRIKKLNERVLIPPPELIEMGYSSSSISRGADGKGKLGPQ